MNNGLTGRINDVKQSNRIFQFKQVCSELRFKNRDGVNVTDVWWEAEAGGRAAEGSRPHGGQTGRWCSETDARRRHKSVWHGVLKLTSSERYGGASYGWPQS